MGDRRKLVVCSAMIKPVRMLIHDGLINWIDRIINVPRHTFVVDSKTLPLSRDNPVGYWYCAGAFCDVIEPGVTQSTHVADIEYAKCLVHPDIMDDDPLRPELVIGGEYNRNYVCHNITNRVLYATDEQLTLIDLPIPISGYKFVVNSPKGIYGQNKIEWEQRKRKCASYLGNPNDPRKTIGAGGGDAISIQRTEEEELFRIHLRATGSRFKALTITRDLREIDVEFNSRSSELYRQVFAGEINDYKFNDEMVELCHETYRSTIGQVGHELADLIYPEHAQADTNFEPPTAASVKVGAASS